VVRQVTIGYFKVITTNHYARLKAGIPVFPLPQNIGSCRIWNFWSSLHAQFKKKRI